MIVNPHLFATFLAITVVVLITPGPIVTLLITTGATQGVKAALTTVAGTALGSAAQLTLIALGLAWMLENAAGVFEVLRWLGALYLVWLGIGAWRSASDQEQAIDRASINIRRGFLVALTNPKTIAFFTAFLPQFVDAHLAAGPQLAAMCVASVLLAGVTDTGWAMASGYGRKWLMHPSRMKLLGRLSGLTLIGGGIWLSLVRRPA